MFFWKSKTPLHDACKANSVGKASKLLRNGYAVNSKDEQGRTPLHLAAELGAIEAIALLVENGADVQALDSQGRSTLQYAIDASEQIRSSLETAYERTGSYADERESTRFLVKKLIQLLEKRRGTKALNDDIGDLPLGRVTKLEQAGDHRIEREFSYLAGMSYEIGGFGEVSETLLYLMRGYGPRQVAYALLLADTQRLFNDIKRALEGGKSSSS